MSNKKETINRLVMCILMYFVSMNIFLDIANRDALESFALVCASVLSSIFFVGMNTFGFHLYLHLQMEKKPKFEIQEQKLGEYTQDEYPLWISSNEIKVLIYACNRTKDYSIKYVADNYKNPDRDNIVNDSNDRIISLDILLCKLEGNYE